MTKLKMTQVRSALDHPYFEDHSVKVSKYSPKFVEKTVAGKMTLVLDGHDDVGSFVQANRDNGDIYTILTRFKNGDTSGFRSSPGIYGDFTRVPTNINDMFNYFKSSQSRFEQLPLELRSKFDNSYLKFTDSVMNGTAKKLIDEFYAPKPGDPVESVNIKKEVKDE